MPVRCGHHVEQLLDGRVFVAHEQEQNVNTSLRFLGMCGHAHCGGRGEDRGHDVEAVGDT